jgi:hypothetical protein
VLESGSGKAKCQVGAEWAVICSEFTKRLGFCQLEGIKCGQADIQGRGRIDNVIAHNDLSFKKLKQGAQRLR